MANTIWFDVTALYEWNRPPIGLIRVELECARHFLAEFKNETRFCRHDSVEDIYVHVSYEEVESYFQRLDSYSEDMLLRQSDGPGEWLKSFIKAAVGYLPRPLRQAVIRPLKRCRHIIIKGKRKMIRMISLCPAFIHDLPSDIGPNVIRGDVFVTLGLDWNRNISPVLNAMKEARGIKVLSMCHDVIPIKFPHLSPLQDYSHRFADYIIDMAGCADTILCDSKNTLRDLERYLSTIGRHCPHLAVVRLGEDIKAGLGAVGQQVRAVCQTPYILFVSTIEGRKNHEILYRAYTRFMEAGRRDLPRLVFVGHLGWRVDDFLSDLRLDRSINGSIVMLNHVNDSELSLLYCNALFTVYPSLYEGWGLPVAESLAHGKFCIASNSSSLPEVGGDFVDYLDPWDLTGWIERMAHYIDNPVEVRKKEEKIRMNYKPHPWSETARVIIERAMRL